MSAAPWALLVLLCCCLLAWYLTFTASRLDRLHLRVETSRAALDAELARRASAAVELATSGLLDPASALLLAGAAAAALDAPRGPGPLEPHGGAREERDRCDEERWRAENDLSQALRAALAPEVLAAAPTTPAGPVERLLAAVRRVELARRFHNDAVTQARRLRGKRSVRWARLAGHARMPRTADFDDAAALARGGPAGVPPGTGAPDRHSHPGSGS